MVRSFEVSVESYAKNISPYIIILGLSGFRLEKIPRFLRISFSRCCFRPVGMKAFARAVRTLVDRGSKMDAAVAKLAKIPFELDDNLWREVLWRPETKIMLTKYGRLAQNVMLHRIGEKPETKNYNVLSEYKRITGFDFPK